MTILKKYVIVGPPDPDSDDNFYWSNEWGWGSFEGCTQFSREIFISLLPVESAGLQSVNSVGERGTFYRLIGEKEIYEPKNNH